MIDYKSTKGTPFFLMLIGIMLYVSMGCFMVYLTRRTEFLGLYIVTGIICALASKCSHSKFGAGPMVVIIYLITLTCTTYISHAHGFDLTTLVFSLCLTFGFLEFAWTLPIHCIFAIYFLSTVASTFFLYYSSFTLGFNFGLVVPLHILFLWRGVNSFLQHETFSENMKLEKYKAFRSTVVKVRHEFNNLSMIIALSLDAMEITKEETKEETKEYKNLRSSLKRFVAVIKSLEETKNYSVEKYSDDETMVKVQEIESV